MQSIDQKTPDTAKVVSRAVSQLHEILELLKVDGSGLGMAEYIALKTARLMLKELLNVLERLEQALQ